MAAELRGPVPDQAGAARIMFEIAQGNLIDGPVPEAFRSYDGAPIESGLALQLAVLEHWSKAGEAVGGYKIGWTSRGARDRGGEGFRPFGYVLASRILPSGSVVERSRVPRGRVEPEICLTIAKRLGGPHVTRDEARAAVQGVAGGFELLAPRLPDGSPMPCRLGNGLNNWGLVYGPQHPPDVALDAISVELFADGALVGTGLSGPDTVDDPYLSLARAAVLLHKYGRAFEPGQRVLTGSILPSASIEGVARYEATFGPLGSVSVRFQ